LTIKKNNTEIEIVPKLSFPWIIIGLVQSDGVFYVAISPTKKNISIKPTFQIEMTMDSLDIFKKIKNYFNFPPGNIFFNKKKNYCLYVINDFYSLWHILIVHFYYYPLTSSKQKSFLIFVEVLVLLYPYYYKKKYKSKILITYIINLVWNMNPGSTRKL